MISRPHAELTCHRMAAWLDGRCVRIRVQGAKVAGLHRFFAMFTQVSRVPHPVFKITSTQLVTHENVKKTIRDLRYVRR